MRILKRSKEYTEAETPYPLKICCEHCGSELEIEESDLEVGPFGAMWFTCPVCNEKDMADEIEGITLTIDNIEFPKHFYYFGNGEELDNDEVKKYIKEGVNYFRRHPNEFAFVTGTGDSQIVVLNYSGDQNYYVSVAKGYYDMEIPYEDADYAVQNEFGWVFTNTGVNTKKELKDG